MMIFNEIVEYQLKQVFGLEYLRECLELRLKLLRENEASKSEFEKNENDILYYQTRNSINKVFHQIKEKRKELQETMIIYFQELQDLKTKKNKDGNDNLPDNS
jgi:hypothetical protein